MSSLTLIVILSVLVLLAAALKAWIAIRADRAQGRGSLPGKGYHTIDASYHSGGSGGGHTSHYRVPQDPQEYARLFIPKEPRK